MKTKVLTIVRIAGVTLFCVALACSSIQAASGGPSKGIRALALGKVFSVPRYQGDISNILTDICYRPAQKCFRVCSEGGDGQFPLINGEVVFDSPGFMSSTGGYLIRGMAEGPVGLCAVNNHGPEIFYGKERLPLPRTIGDVSGLAFDGHDFWVADVRSNQVHQVRIVGKPGKMQCQLISSRPHPGMSIVGVAWDGKRLWTCDPDRFYILGANGSVEAEYDAPKNVSGFCFAGGSIYATSAYRPEIYRFDLVQ